MNGTFVHHHLKIAPVFYRDVISGKKKFEIRVNDRNFLEGDHLVLREFEDGEYTGNEVEVLVTYIPDFPLPGNYVVMGIAPVEGNLDLNQADLLTITDWFNGYVAKYYDSNPDNVKKRMPQQHKDLIDRILEAQGVLDREESQ